MKCLECNKKLFISETDEMSLCDKCFEKIQNQ